MNLSDNSTDACAAAMDNRDIERNALAAAFEQAAELPGLAIDALDKLRTKFASEAFNLVVLGEFKRGKSTLINALLGAEWMPTGVVPLTSVVTVLRYAAQADVQVLFESGQTRSVALDDLSDYVTERGNPGNTKGVREVQVLAPAAWLDGGLRLVDTPGIGSVHRHNTEATLRYLPQADAVIFVVCADQPVSRAELNFLAEIRGYAGRIFCVLNKIDYLAEAERAESIAFTAAALRDTLGMQVPLFALSARAALQARLMGDAQAWEDSGASALDAAMRRFLRAEGGDVWLDAMRRQLLRLLTERRIALELEWQALGLPLEELEAKLAAFMHKQQTSRQVRSDLDALLDADTRRLFTTQVEPDLNAFGHTLATELRSNLALWSNELASNGSRALQSGLEERLIVAIRNGFDTWRVREDAMVQQAFEHICERFWRGVGDIVDELLRYGAELFALSFVPVSVESLWRKRSDFYYKFWQELPSLMMLGGVLVRLLPGVLGHRIILRRARRRAQELVETQSGRLRHDFDERIKRSAAEFKREIIERTDAAIDGVTSAIRAAQATRASSEITLVARRTELRPMLDQIRDLELQLAPTTENSAQGVE